MSLFCKPRPSKVKGALIFVGAFVAYIALQHHAEKLFKKTIEKASKAFSE